MDILTEDQRENLERFMDVTRTCEDLATHCLSIANWNLEEACDVLFANPRLRMPKSLERQKKYDAVYETYQDDSVDLILADGITRLCDNIQVDPQDIVMLVLAWHMKASTMCQFSKQELVDGFESLGIETVEQLKEKIPFMRSELEDSHKFRQIYNFAFDWCKDKGQKVLPLDTALEMWKLLFAQKKWPLLDDWFQFLQGKHNKAISQDLWSQTLEFATTVDTSLSNYDPAGAWPCVIDDFVEYMIETGKVQKA
ncbi:DCN1-like protein 1 isoform X2 [Sesamum indicum]|uniref:Defective in cullin neddylation protein n=1 Tax=Sesamum indicum TaxID=4182 RepID=A0A6I9UCX4_SESIN|nr:DCN1-like protein 1 isoform X2 [Sesamum indicum]